MTTPLRENVPSPRTVVPRPRERAPEPLGSSGDEIDLLAYVAVCWRYRYVLLVLALVVALTTYAINRNIAPTYEVTFRMMASESKLGDEPARAVSVASFRELLQSQSLAATILDEFKLTSPPHDLTPRRFLASNVDIDAIPDTAIIRVAVRLRDPDVLVRLANRYADAVVELAQRLSQEEMVYTKDRIKLEADSAQKRLAQAVDALKTFQRRTQIELLRKDVDSLLVGRPDALALSVQIEGERARLRQVETELSNQEPVRDARRTVDGVSPLRPLPPLPAPAEPPDIAGKAKPASAAGATEPAPAADAAKPPTAPAARKPEPSEPQDLRLRSDVLNPYINPVYEALSRDVADARSRLAGLERQRRELVDRLKLDAPSAEKLNRLYEAEAELARLTREHDLSRASYLSAATKHEEARLQITMRSPRLQVLDGALAPDRPVAPRSLRNTIAATLITLTLGIAGVLIFDARRRSQPA
jgi:capsular polysaccharide biosynthesis protein